MQDGNISNMDSDNVGDVWSYLDIFPLTSCSCSSSFLRLSCSLSSSAYLCFSAWFSSRTTKPHSAARIFSRLASASSCASLSTSARYCSTDSPHPPSAAIVPVARSVARALGRSVGRCGYSPPHHHHHHHRRPAAAASCRSTGLWRSSRGGRRLRDAQYPPLCCSPRGERQPGQPLHGRTTRRRKLPTKCKTETARRRASRQSLKSSAALWRQIRASHWAMRMNVSPLRIGSVLLLRNTQQNIDFCLFMGTRTPPSGCQQTEHCRGEMKSTYTRLILIKQTFN